MKTALTKNKTLTAEQAREITIKNNKDAVINEIRVIEIDPKKKRKIILKQKFRNI